MTDNRTIRLKVAQAMVERQFNEWDNLDGGEQGYFLQLADAAIEALSALPAVEGWLPIFGCPKDGRVVMLTSDSPLWKYPFPAKWCDKQQWWIFADEWEWLNDCVAVSDLVSHWQPVTSPLPAPPIE